MDAVPPHKTESKPSEKPGQHNLDSLENNIKTLEADIEVANLTEREKLIIQRLEVLLRLINMRIKDLEKSKEMKTKQLRQI